MLFLVLCDSLLLLLLVFTRRHFYEAFLLFRFIPNLVNSFPILVLVAQRFKVWQSLVLQNFLRLRFSLLRISLIFVTFRLDLKSSLSGEMLLELEVVISLIFVLVSSVGFLY